MFGFFRKSDPSQQETQVGARSAALRAQSEMINDAFTLFMEEKVRELRSRVAARRQEQPPPETGDEYDALQGHLGWALGED
jgi:hypothetical protein